MNDVNPATDAPATTDAAAPVEPTTEGAATEAAPAEGDNA